MALITSYLDISPITKSLFTLDFQEMDMVPKKKKIS